MDREFTPYETSKRRVTALPRRNEWVFSSAQIIDGSDHNTKRREQYHARKGQVAPVGGVKMRSASGRIAEPSIAHRQAC